MVVVQIITAVIFLLILPGVSLSFVLFKWGTIDWIERAGISLGLSITIIPLIAFYLHLVGIPIRKDTIFLQTLLLIFIAVMLALFRHRDYLRHIKRK